MGRECRKSADRCPVEVNRPFHPAEKAALAIAAIPSAWRPAVHPRWKDQRPSLDWVAVRALHDPDTAPWGQVRTLLIIIEAGARKARAQTEQTS